MSKPLDIKKGDIVARVSNGHYGDLNLYRIETAGKAQTRAVSYGCTSTSATWARDFFTDGDSFVISQKEADTFLAKSRKIYNARAWPSNRGQFNALVEKTIKPHGLTFKPRQTV